MRNLTRNFDHPIWVEFVTNCPILGFIISRPWGFKKGDGRHYSNLNLWIVAVFRVQSRISHGPQHIIRRIRTQNYGRRRGSQLQWWFGFAQPNRGEKPKLSHLSTCLHLKYRFPYTFSIALHLNHDVRQIRFGVGIPDLLRFFRRFKAYVLFKFLHSLQFFAQFPQLHWSPICIWLPVIQQQTKYFTGTAASSSTSTSLVLQQCGSSQ